MLLLTAGRPDPCGTANKSRLKVLLQTRRLDPALRSQRIDEGAVVDRGHRPALRKMARRRCGVTGSSVTAPGMPMASSIALATTAPTALMPASPPPLRA